MSDIFDRLPVGIGALQRDLGLTSGSETEKAQGGQFGFVKSDSSSASKGDTVSFSPEGLKLAAEQQGGDPAANATHDGSKLGKEEGSEEAKGPVEQMIDRLEKRIKELEQEIEKLESEDMPQEMKDKLIAAKRNELMQYQQQLAEARQQLQQDSGTSDALKGATAYVRPDS